MSAILIARIGRLGLRHRREVSRRKLARGRAEKWERGEERKREKRQRGKESVEDGARMESGGTCSVLCSYSEKPRRPNGQLRSYSGNAAEQRVSLWSIRTPLTAGTAPVRKIDSESTLGYFVLSLLHRTEIQSQEIF